MSTDNYAKFTDAVAADPELAAKVQAAHAAAAREIAEQLAALSAEAGAPFTADEFLADASRQAAELSDEDLEAVAGGAWQANEGNVLLSIFTFGLICAAAAAASAALSKVEDCQLVHDRGGRK